MQNVRKIAAAIMLPVAVSVVPMETKGKADVSVSVPEVVSPEIPAPLVNIPDIPTPKSSDAYNIDNSRESNNTFTADNSRTYNNNGRNIQVGKICDEVVIHVANTDQKGGDMIRQEIMNILEELGEG